MSKDNLNKIKALAAEGLLTKDNIHKAIRQDYHELIGSGSTCYNAWITLSNNYDKSVMTIRRIVKDY